MKTYMEQRRRAVGQGIAAAVLFIIRIALSTAHRPAGER